MLIIQQKTRRDFLRLGATSFLGAAALATLPTLAVDATQSRRGRMQTHLGERGRFKLIDEALEQGVSNGTVAGVVALAADSRGVVYEAAYGNRDLAGRWDRLHWVRVGVLVAMFVVLTIGVV